MPSDGDGSSRTMDRYVHPRNVPLVHRRAHDAFVKALVKFVSSLKRGHATDPEAQLTRLVTEEAAQRVVEQVQHTVDQGATLVYGGKRDGAAMDVTILDNDGGHGHRDRHGSIRPGSADHHVRYGRRGGCDRERIEIRPERICDHK